MKHINKFESFGKDFKSFVKDLKSVSKEFIEKDFPDMVKDLKSPDFRKSFVKDLKSASKEFIGIDEPYKGGILKWELVNGEWTAQWRNYTFKILKELDQKGPRHKKWRLDFMNNHSCHSSWYDSINSASKDAMTFYVPMLLKSGNEDEEDYDGEYINNNEYNDLEDELEDGYYFEDEDEDYYENMKYLKTFESFRMNEGILDNIKKGVKNLFTKKVDKTDIPDVPETTKKVDPKSNIIELYDVSIMEHGYLTDWIHKNINGDNIKWKKYAYDEYELDISELSSFDAIKLKAWLTLKGYRTHKKPKVINLSDDVKQQIKSLGYSDLYTTALEWIKKCGYDVRGVSAWPTSTITITLEGLKSMDSALIGVRLQDGKIKVGSSPSNLKVCNGPDELKSLVDALKTTEKERKQERKRLEKESLEALERSRKWRKPEKVTKEVWDTKLRHGKVPFTKKETEFFQKFKEKNENKKRKIDLGKLGESDTISIKYQNNNYEYYTYIIKLDDEWYAIKAGYYEMVVDVTNVEGDWEGSHYEEFFVCDEFEEVLGYLERKDSYYFPDELNSKREINNNEEEGDTNSNVDMMGRSLEDGYELEDEDEEDEEYYDDGFSDDEEEIAGEEEEDYDEDEEDTFDLFRLITEYLPENKEQIMSRDGKLVIRPDSGDPVDIICGKQIISRDYRDIIENADIDRTKPEYKGVIELLWDIFGGTINEQGYKVLDPHIGAIYGDSITLDRQIEIYKRLEAKGFACTNIVLGIGSFTYQYNTRDTFGFAAKGAWFEADGKSYDIYKDPATDDGTKKSLRGLVMVDENYEVHVQCTPEQEAGGILHTIYEDGKFFNQTTLTEIREKLKSSI